MKREVYAVGDLPNLPLLTEIVREAQNEYMGFQLPPSKIAEIKWFINHRVQALIAIGEWQTKSFLNGRKIVYKEIVVLKSDSDPSDLKVIPRWEYEEE